MRRITCRFVTVILCLLFIGKLMAQETTSEIRGVVRDPNGPVSEATVSAVHIPTRTKYTTTSRKDGRYNLPNLRVGGPYEITITFVGYKPETQKNITLDLGQEFNADFKLTRESQQLEEVTE